MTTDASSPTDGIPSAESLRESIDRHLRGLGFSPNCKGYFIDEELTKQKIRDLYASHRLEILRQNRPFVEAYGHELSGCFASGRHVDPALISPKLIEVKNDRQARLFRFACMLWSVPVSRGFGRRMRFLVLDKQNECLMGVFALGDPVFNLSARDEWVGWNHEDRRERLVHVMDGYVVGAVPPYSQLIGGKLIAALMGSKEVRRAYRRKYLDREAVISGKRKRPSLVLLTTTSALGRSSIYNRLFIPDGPRFLRIGTTKGFGHFHLSGELFESLRGYLEAVGHPYASGNRFGMGPNWRLRVLRAAMREIGIDGSSMLNHGIKREVYAIPLADNWREVLLGQRRRVLPRTLPAREIANFCLDRWILPRASRDERYKTFDRGKIMDCLLNGGPGPNW